MCGSCRRRVVEITCRALGGKAWVIKIGSFCGAKGREEKSKKKSLEKVAGDATGLCEERAINEIKCQQYAC